MSASTQSTDRVVQNADASGESAPMTGREIAASLSVASLPLLGAVGTIATFQTLSFKMPEWRFNRIIEDTAERVSTPTFGVRASPAFTGFVGSTTIWVSGFQGSSDPRLEALEKKLRNEVGPLAYSFNRSYGKNPEATIRIWTDTHHRSKDLYRDSLSNATAVLEVIGDFTRSNTSTGNTGAR